MPYSSYIVVFGPYFDCWGSLPKNGSLLGLGPYLKAWGSLLVLEAVQLSLSFSFSQYENIQGAPPMVYHDFSLPLVYGMAFLAVALNKVEE